MRRPDSMRFRLEELELYGCSESSVALMHQGGFNLSSVGAAAMGDGAAVRRRCHVDYLAQSESQFAEPGNGGIAAGGDDRLGRSYLYYHAAPPDGKRALCGLFLPASKQAFVFVLDTVASNRMPNLETLLDRFIDEAQAFSEDADDANAEARVLPSKGYRFRVRVDTSEQELMRRLSEEIRRRLLGGAHQGGPRLMLIQSARTLASWHELCVALREMPCAQLHRHDSNDVFADALQWQLRASEAMLHSFLRLGVTYSEQLQRCRYLGVS